MFTIYFSSLVWPRFILRQFGHVLFKDILKNFYFLFFSAADTFVFKFIAVILDPSQQQPERSYEVETVLLSVLPFIFPDVFLESDVYCSLNFEILKLCVAESKIFEGNNLPPKWLKTGFLEFIEKIVISFYYGLQ